LIIFFSHPKAIVDREFFAGPAYPPFCHRKEFGRLIAAALHVIVSLSSNAPVIYKSKAGGAVFLPFLPAVEKQAVFIMK